MDAPRAFRSAGMGGQRGAPPTGSSSPIANDIVDRATRARIAATRYQRAMQIRGERQGPAPRAAQSGADISALRGEQAAERRFEGERRPFGSGQPQRTWS